MPDNEMVRLKSLLEVLHDEAEKLLAKHEIWSSYGWRDEDTPDSEYAGIAMWELNPPFEYDWNSLFEGRTPRQTPTRRQETLMASGEDLIAAMTFARRSLGIALCFAEVSNPDNVGGNEEFWQEYATTLMWLNIASDRLREFFLMARFGETKQEHDERYRQSHGTYRVPYSAPFKEKIDPSSDLKICLEQLSTLADNLQEHRRERNDRVHKVATITAQRSIDLLREQRRVSERAAAETGPTFHDEALTPAIEAMKLWFGRMMKATSLVFEFEYFHRTKNS
jgi:hypothetical protein